MLERLAGNDALKAELGTALRGGRLPHAVLLVGEPGCGAGFAARCLAADYLYPAGGPHAEAVLKKEDTECLVLQGEGASGQIPVKKVREAREAIQRSALSTDAAGRVLFIYGAQNLNGSSANAMLKIIEEPPEGVLFLLTATSAATVLPTIRSRCAAYTIAPVPAADCAARLKAERLPAKAAEELAFLYEGHIGTALKSWNDPTAKAALGMAKTLCGYAAQGDTYRALALLTKYERDKDGFAALLWTLDQLCSAVLRRPAYGQEQCGGLTPDRAAQILQVSAATRKTVTGNGNLRLAVTDGGDAFLPLGEETDDPTLPGELAYIDDAGAVCRCWNWRDGVRAALSDDSADAFLAIECVEPERMGDCQAAIDRLSELLERYLGATVVVKTLVTRDNPCVEL